MVAAIGAIGAVAGGAIAANGAENAADTQAGAARDAQASQQRMFDLTNSQQAPWRQAGATALGQLSSGTAPGGSFSHAFDANDLNSNLAPNYQFQLDQGLGAIKNASNLQTGLLSGNTLKGINDYAQNFAGNAYQNAFANYNTNQSNIFNRLASIAQIGQTANGQSATAGLGYAGNIGSAQLAAGASQAAGITGSANAISGAINNAGSWFASNSGGGGGISNADVNASHDAGMAYINADPALFSG